MDAPAGRGLWWNLGWNLRQECDLNRWLCWSVCPVREPCKSKHSEIQENLKNTNLPQFCDVVVSCEAPATEGSRSSGQRRRFYRIQRSWPKNPKPPGLSKPKIFEQRPPNQKSFKNISKEDSLKLKAPNKISIHQYKWKVTNIPNFQRISWG